jgi:hypothetical protein
MSASTPELFAEVSIDYAHARKLMRPAAPLLAPGIHQKWYVVHPASRPFVEREIGAAQAFLLDEVATGRLALRNEVGFTVQHRCSSLDIFYVCSWRNDNELWETIYWRPHGSSFQVVPRETKTATYCVWVIPAVAHEQRAWVAYLNSARDAAARAAWARDQFDGPVG